MLPATTKIKSHIKTRPYKDFLIKNALDYWRKEIVNLPPAPELPTAKNPEKIENQKFYRLESRIDAETWLRLKKRAARSNLTSSGILLAAYTDIIGRWSKNSQFTINMTMFNRFPFHEQVNSIVGDFTNLSLLSVDCGKNEPFEKRAQAIQDKVWENLENRYVSGVEVARELQKIKGNRKKTVFPVVFTSALALNKKKENNATFTLPEAVPVKINYAISQTPQVWLDHQIYEHDKGVVLVWDALKELFPQGMVDDMFETYCTLINRLANEEESWHEMTPFDLPRPQISMRKKVNNTHGPVSPKMLHTLFEEQALSNPENIALIDSNRKMTYEELSVQSDNIAHDLILKGVKPNTLVAVVMEKGWEQAAAVLGILKSGAAYLPIDPLLPRDRILYILENCDVKIALTQSRLIDFLNLPERYDCQVVEYTNRCERLEKSQIQYHPDNLAYVIFTSGSTGRPKGVMIDHKGALNTVLDINKRFGIGAEDKCLALSALNFDLSVYDIFGLLSAGGTVVIPAPDKTKDPVHWAQLMDSENITLWNSVPALMQMFVTHKTGRNQKLPDSLRLVLMSGDWIPIELCKTIQKKSADIKMISLGGATEASIWSVMHPIDQIDKNLKSIPYGRALSNQTVLVLNQKMETCPDYVPGDLYIGGIGLAKGYWKDADKTATSFITHPRTGEKLYKTGDLGRYLPDGNIEFLGREDFQVKIRGHRIELGEIESVVKQHKGIEDAVVVTGNSGNHLFLKGYVIPKNRPSRQNGEKMKEDASRLNFGEKATITDPLKRMKFKLKRMAIRKDLTDCKKIEFGTLPGNKTSIKMFSKRATYREFITDSIPFDTFGKFMSSIAALEVSGNLFPKYQYGSAGGLYPVQVYLHVKSDKIKGVPEGTYYFNPAVNRLETLSDESLPPEVFAGNDDIYGASAFSIFIICDKNAIEPLYGENSRKFSYLEAGLISQQLELSAFQNKIGLCQIGVIHFDEIRHMFNLDRQHEYLHCLVGGPIAQDTDWTYLDNQRHFTDHKMEEESGVDENKLIEAVSGLVRKKLPQYMVPDSFDVIEALPITANGKIDRKQLSQLAKSTIKCHGEKDILPTSEMEIKLSNILKGILNLPQVGGHSKFL